MLVKFSPAGDAPADQRMRDLLVCEHLALRTLAAADIPAARTQLFSGAGRVFLESERFDRSGSSAPGEPVGRGYSVAVFQEPRDEYRDVAVGAVLSATPQIIEEARDAVGRAL